MWKPSSVSQRFTKNLPTFANNVLRENFPILLVLVLYAAASWIVQFILDQGTMSGNRLGTGYLAGYIPPVFALIFLTRIFPRFKEGFTGLGIVCREVRENHFSLEAIANLMLILVVVPIFLLSFHTFKIAIPALHPFSWDEPLMKLDFAVHLGHHPWLLVQPFLGYPEITRVINYIYHHVWGGVLFTMVFWMAWSPRRHLRKQFFLSFLITWIGLGTVLAVVFSSAGPCYFDKISDLENPYAPLMSYLSSIPDLPAIHAQKMLWEIHAHKMPVYFTGISAMPSMHVAAAVLCALVGWHLNWAVGLTLGLFAGLIQLGTIHLGWHYAVDGYLSALLTWLIWRGTSRIVNRKVSENGNEASRDRGGVCGSRTGG